VYHTQDKKFGLSPVPDKSNYTIQYEYWKIHTDLSAHGDTPDLDDRFMNTIVSKAKYYAYMLRSDVQSAGLAFRDYKEMLGQLQKEYISTKSYMADTRI